MFEWKEYSLYTIGYLKNHWTKHRLVCTHVDAFSKMILKIMGTLLTFSIIDLKKKIEDDSLRES